MSVNYGDVLYHKTFDKFYLVVQRESKTPKTVGDIVLIRFVPNDAPNVCGLGDNDEETMFNSSNALGKELKEGTVVHICNMAYIFNDLYRKEAFKELVK